MISYEIRDWMENARFLTANRLPRAKFERLLDSDCVHKQQEVFQQVVVQSSQGAPSHAGLKNNSGNKPATTTFFDDMSIQSMVDIG